MKNPFSLFNFGRKGIVLVYEPSSQKGVASSVLPEEFGRQMQYLKQKKYHVVTLAEMCERLSEGKSVRSCVAIAFSDEHKDFFKTIFPVLKRYNFPAAVFLSIGSGSMTPGDITRTARTSNLIDFMPRVALPPGASRPSLKDIMKRINDSRLSVEALTAKPADILLYPREGYGKEIVEGLRRTRAWLGGITPERGYVEKGDDPLLLRRLGVTPATAFAVFKKALP